MEIRTYKLEDHPQVIANLKEAELFDEVWDSEDNLKSMIEKDPESILVAEEKGLVIGNIFIIPYGSKIQYLFRLAVKKEFRKQGIATELLNKALDIAKKRNIEEIGLYVDSGNLDLQDFYKKRGYKTSLKTYFYMWTELR
jgi:ribosomal protein S18 acetylase RimI-like enzyme